MDMFKFIWMEWITRETLSPNMHYHYYYYCFCVERSAGAKPTIHMRSNHNKCDSKSARIVCVHCPTENYDGLCFDLCALSVELEVFTHWHELCSVVCVPFGHTLCNNSIWMDSHWWIGLAQRLDRCTAECRRDWWGETPDPAHKSIASHRIAWNAIAELFGTRLKLIKLNVICKQFGFLSTHRNCMNHEAVPLLLLNILSHRHTNYLFPITDDKRTVLQTDKCRAIECVR